MTTLGTPKKPAIAWVRIIAMNRFTIANTTDPVTGLPKELMGYYGITRNKKVVVFYLFADKIKSSPNVLEKIGVGWRVLCYTDTLEHIDTQVKKLRGISKQVPNVRFHNKFVAPRILYTRYVDGNGTVVSLGPHEADLKPLLHRSEFCDILRRYLQGQLID